MTRTFRTGALLLAGPAVLGLGLSAAGPASAAASAAGSAGPASVARPAVVCPDASPIVVDGFAFDPADVKPGGSSTADLITTNCSAGTVGTQEEWTGQWLSTTGTGPAAGCPVIDPMVRDVSYAAGQEIAENTVYTVPSTCTAGELAVTVQISIPSGSVTSVVTATAYLRIDQIAQ